MEPDWPICVDCGGHGVEEYDGQRLCGACVAIRLEIEADLLGADE